MKNRTFFLMLLSIVFIIAGGAGNKNQTFFKAPKGFTFVPPGTLVVDGKTITINAFYISTCEITNAQYNEFLEDLKKQPDTTDYSIAKIKSSNWKSLQAANGMEYEQWANYPVVNISKEGAVLYCKWLTKKINEKNGVTMCCDFRLPCKEEWEYAARGGLADAIFPWNGKYLRDFRGCFLAHYKVIGQEFGPCEVRKYSPNPYGLYDMAGNVAEMVYGADIVKGGSWDGLAYEMQITQDMPYSVSPTVGFRPVVTYLGKNISSN